MLTISGLTKIRSGLVVFTLALLSGCAFTTGGAPSQLGLNSLPTTSYSVCTGSHASRLAAREEVGRVCRPAAALQVIL